tara:strand:+ start:36732 stop:37910 length:1179 start_codon:yes stop_codon:yes gene_type:complete
MRVGSNLLYIFYIFLLVLTTNFIDFNESFEIFSDQVTYFKIIDSAPNLPSDALDSYQAQRFFFPFIIGTIINLFKLSDYTQEFLIVINLVLIFIIILILNNLFKKENIDKIFYPFLISIILFNPYFSRSFIYAPLMINDLIFSLGSLFFILGFKNKNIFVLTISVLICAFSRQTTMIIIPILLGIFIFEKKLKTNINKLWFLFLSLEIVFIFFLTTSISSEFSKDLSFKNVLFGIFYFDYSLSDSILFLLRFYIANFIICYFIYKFFINKIYLNLTFENRVTIIISFLIALAFWTQPILAGPKIGGGNIARLTVLSLPIFVYCISLILKDFEVKKKYLNLIILLLFFSSFHHQYSVLKKLELYNSWIFVLLNLITITIFVFIFNKKMILKRK